MMQRQPSAATSDRPLRRDALQPTRNRPVDSTQLIGRYRTPRFRYGAVVTDAVRGPVTIVGLTDAPIPWPIGQRRQARSLVVFGGLERAIRTESNLAVCHWWGVSACTVRKWRRALGVGIATPGTSRLKREHLLPRLSEMQALIDYSNPERCAKIGAARRGKSRPPHVIAAVRRANLGRKFSEERRQSIRERIRRTGLLPPKAGRPWTAEEDRLVRRLPPAEVAQRTGRSLWAVYHRRRALGLTKAQRS